jgi:hypothetical protein
MKNRPDALGNAENGFECANMKTGPDALCKKPKTGLGAQNMKTACRTLGKDENEYGSANHENWTQRLV